MEVKKVKVERNKPVHLSLSIVEINKILMHEFWYDHIEPKYQNNASLFHMDTDSFFVHIKTEKFYKDIADDVKKYLIHQIMKLIDHQQKEWIKNHRLNERWTRKKDYNRICCF